MNLLNWLDDIFSKDERAKIKELEVLNENLSKDREDLLKETVDLTAELVDIKTKETNKNLNSKLEEYWNTKRPNNDSLQYHARPRIDSETGTITNENIQVDPRIFFQSDSTLPVFKGTNDQIANDTLVWVAQNIKYTTDKKPYEMWQFAFETLDRKAGDCEDGGTLIANILINSGVPYWRVRVNAGDVQIGKNKFGHSFCTYLRESDNTWYVLDWCVNPNSCTNFGTKWKDAEEYLNIWFSFNTKFIFGDLPKEG